MARGVLFITHDFGVGRRTLPDRGGGHEQGAHRRDRHTRRGPEQSAPSLHPAADRRCAALCLDRHRAAVTTPPFLDIINVSKSFQRGGFLARKTEVKAVRDASLVVARGETVGLVGESGSGKSTLARCVVRLYDPSSGSINVEGVDIAPLSKAEMKPLRKKIQMVFQDPFASLNPRRRVGEIIAEGPITHGTPRAEALARARELLGLVGLDAGAIDRFPHEFSGGQRQRIGLARALALQPDLLVADEPVSALDVSVQAQVLDLIADLKARLGLTMLFITHDLRIAAQICDRIAVMKQGEIVELGPTRDVFETPRHAYTKELLAAIPGRVWEATRGAPITQPS